MALDDRRATAKDVAVLAGVSLGTVSNVVNGRSGVSDQLRARVEAAITELGYVRNEAARQLRAGRSRVIALVVPDVANPFFDDVAAGADEAADAHDAMVIISSSASSPAREHRHLQRLSQQRLLGLAITPMFDPPWSLLEEFERHGTPVVLIDHLPTRRRGAQAVSVDDDLGGQLVGQHLIATGHTRITYLAPLFQQTRAREAGLRRAVGRGAAIELVRCPAMTIEAGRRAAEELAGAPERPTAVFCGNDLIAIGLLSGLERHGTRVPRDVAVVGYDDIEMAAVASVPLTSVRQPRHELGARAVERLLGPARPTGITVLRPELVIRASTTRTTAASH